ncbi:FtsX-like permease family protein [Dactylosporangium sp. NPDC048998]|uniref:FtsX-like permease family protein n=1 Tax=Dactylosporangium sp. NPDC048998 TaxID=3363976 RepID=UPI003718EE18
MTGADRRSRDLLAGQTLGPGANPAGYVATPPLLLTTLSVANDMLRGTRATDSIRAPISAIRVRVAGARDYSKTAQERVRIVAEEIATRTGLDVDITYGSSPAPQTVDLAPGSYGRPDLLVSEGWSKKGVATAIITSVDRKSLVLFVLVLVVCALFLANAVTAAVRDRRSELAVLACLGWPARRIAASILGEVTALGLAAGVASLALAAPLGGLLDIGIVWYQALLAVPIAIGLSLVAGALPALRAAGAHPADGLRPAVAPVRRAASPRTVVGLGLVNLARVPRRTVLGAVSLAIGIAALTVLVAITVSFRGELVGTRLGDAVSLRVRSVDTVAVAATVLLGALAVGDVLYLNIRDRAAELATLRASGWSDGMLARLVAAEGFGIGILGGTAGAGAGLAGASWLVGSVAAGLLTVAALAAVVGALVATAAALVPAALLRRLPTAQLLSEE